MIDLSHTLTPHMPVWPGTEQPVIIPACTMETYGCRVKKITMYTHVGTHMDGPAHFLKDGTTLDQMRISHFTGPATRINLSNKSDSTINLEDLIPFKDNIKNSEFVLLYTGWSRFWGDQQYFSDYPVLTSEAATWLLQFNLKGIGLDAASIDHIDSQTCPIHKIILQNNIVIIENLTNLDKLPDKLFQFAAFPIKFGDADGSPVRGVGWW